MPYTPTNWVEGVTTLGPTNMNKIETELAALDSATPVGVPAPTFATTLPGSPVNGQEVILTDSLTSPSFAWRMRYVSGSSLAQKWMFIGGSPYQAWYTTSQSQVGSWASYLPTITVPFAGVYIYEAQAIYGNTVTATIGLSGWYSGALDNDWQVLIQAAAGTNSLSTTGVAKVFTAATAISVGGYTSGTSAISNALAQITPVRLA